MSELDDLIKTGEGYEIEFKQVLEKSIAAEACAFSNASGGKILVGVTDGGKKTRITINNQVLSRVQDTLNQIEPRIHVGITQDDGVIIIDVPEGNLKPYACSDGFYLRIGPNSQKLTRDAIGQMFQRGGVVKFDIQEHSTAMFEDDFDKDAYKRFLQKSGISPSIEPKRLLKNLGCITKAGHFTNVGVLFFTNSIEFLLRQAICTCVLYKGINKVKILDRKDYATNMLDNIDAAVTFVQRHTNLEYIIEHVQRQNVPEIPEIALREAITNAFCHRYYFEEGSNITVEIFDDRVDIRSFGGLPAGLNPDEFGSTSVQRNALIADLLLRANYIEKVGTGIQRIKDAVAELGKGTVEFKYTENWFVVTFSRNLPTRSSPVIVEQISKKPNVTTRQQEILNLFENKPLLNSEEIMSLLNESLSIRLIRMELINLNKLGYLDYIGKTKARQWFLMKK